MFYIVVSDANVLKVVSNVKGTPRTFPKVKKAKNFVDGRHYLRQREWYTTENIDDIPERFKVDL